MGCNSLLHKAALRHAACMARDGHASCLGLIFISSLCTSPLGTDCPVLVFGCLLLCPSRQELRVWGWPACGGLARRALRNTGLPEFLSQRALWGISHKAQVCSCIPCTVPSLLRGGNSSAGELGVLQQCWERNKSSQQPLPEHMFGHLGTHLGAAAGNQPPGLSWCQQRLWPYSQEHISLLGLVPALCCRGLHQPLCGDEAWEHRGPVNRLKTLFF